ncbi:hypothetical protein ACFLQ9_00325 [Bacteroidota bacterium]
MKNSIILILFALALSCNSQNDFPVLKGSYLGQTPPGNSPEIFALGIISTVKGELNAMFSPDGEKFYYTIEVVPGRSYSTYYMQQENNIWSQPIISSLLNEYSGGEPSISPDGKYMFFRSMLDENGNNQSHADIWQINMKSDNSTKPTKIGNVVNSEFNEAYPTLSTDKTLFFHSNREGGKGGVDIYFSNFINGNYTSPFNIGDSINTETHEFHPCISPDGSFLIFTSLNRPDGFGSLDLYISFRKKDGTWTKAKNMGKEINSEAGDYMPYISYDGKYLFFTSTRKKQEILNNNPQNVKPDIYWVDASVINLFNSKR